MTPTATETPQPTATNTPEATATPEPIELNTKFDASVNLDTLPLHSLDELTSGHFVASERQMLTSGGIELPAEVSPDKMLINDPPKDFDLFYYS
jgi:hypothetical protein